MIYHTIWYILMSICQKRANKDWLQAANNWIAILQKWRLQYLKN
jgi:hypothetical protein